MGIYTNIEVLYVSETDNKVKIERRDRKNRSEIRVIDYIHNYTVNTYRFNNIKGTYTNKYLNWKNIACYSKYHFDRSYLKTAVQNDEKLYVRLSMLQDEFEDYCKNLADDIIVGKFDLNNNLNLEGISFFISKKGKLSDYINVYEVIKSYEKFGIELGESQIEQIYRMSEEEIGRCRLGIPMNKAEIIFDGMLMGYPIESVVSRLE